MLRPMKAMMIMSNFLLVMMEKIIDCGFHDGRGNALTGFFVEAFFMAAMYFFCKAKHQPFNTSQRSREQKTQIPLTGDHVKNLLIKEEEHPATPIRWGVQAKICEIARPAYLLMFFLKKDNSNFRVSPRVICKVKSGSHPKYPLSRAPCPCEIEVLTSVVPHITFLETHALPLGTDYPISHNWRFLLSKQ